MTIGRCCCWRCCYCCCYVGVDIDVIVAIVTIAAVVAIVFVVVFIFITRITIIYDCILFAYRRCKMTNSCDFENNCLQEACSTGDLQLVEQVCAGSFSVMS